MNDAFDQRPEARHPLQERRCRGQRLGREAQLRVERPEELLGMDDVDHPVHVRIFPLRRAL
ncbi:MAG: hypothetical protein DME09_09185, partial [Candidatus Rokuibacteriota bacterium]